MVAIVIKQDANGWTSDGQYLANNNSYLNGGIMFKWAIIFLVIALIAAVFGFTGIAGAATNIAWILAVIVMIFWMTAAGASMFSACTCSSCEKSWERYR